MTTAAAPRLEVIDGSVSVAAQSTKHIQLNIPEGFKKFDIRTVYAKNITNTDDITVKIGESGVSGEARYESLPSFMINDILMFPYYDINDSGYINIWVQNTGSSAVNVQYELRITSLS